MLSLALCLSVSRLHLRTTDYMLFNCAQLGLTLKLCSLVITYQKERLQQYSVGVRSGSKWYFLSMFWSSKVTIVVFSVQDLHVISSVVILCFLPLWRDRRAANIYCYIMLLIEASRLSLCQWILMECIGVLEWVGLLAIRHRENG